ncbi:MAG: hypothetical protein K2K39_02535 [Clostridia bacterium]|nr:hypothetical protein [Clostridia bacterium]
MSFFHYIDNAEIEERAYAYLFSLCDSVEMLYAYRNFDIDGLEITALGTEFEGLIPAIISVRHGKSWGMEGRIYKFAITDEVRKIIMKFGLDCELRVREDVYLQLENLTLYNGDKVLYSTCSHEGHLDIDDEFRNKVSDFCRNEIVKTKFYSETLERYKKLPERTRNERAIIRSKLYDLNVHVEDAWRAVIRGVPEWEELTYEEYLTLAKPVFSADVYEELEMAGSFKGLHPAGYPRTLKETEKFRGVPQFRLSPLMHKINQQLDMLQTVFAIEEDFNDWHIDGKDYRRGPSIIINGK